MRKVLRRGPVAAAVLIGITVGCGGGGGSGGPGGPGGPGGGNDGATFDPGLTSAILFVTQVPIPSDFGNVASTFGSHMARPKSAPCGGDLWIRYANGTLRNLTQEAGYGNSGLQGANAIAVRQPSVSWCGMKAVFSMVHGAPLAGDDSARFWQLYEVTGFAPGETVQITKVANQPANANNVSPCYASNGRILFASDRPRNGQPHLYPQLDEYEEIPTNTGLWSLNPQNGNLHILNHSPSGVFHPFVDSYGRIVFTRWDHLERDQQTDLEILGQGFYGTFNYSDESAFAFDTGSNAEVFPEPRTQWISFVNNNPGYTGPLNGWEPHLIGQAQNHFLPWTMNQDGTEEETLNHIGRHELFGSFPKSRNDDSNIQTFFQFPPQVANFQIVDNLMQLSEDPNAPGSYYGVDAREFFTHSAGQIVHVRAPKGQSANNMQVTYITHRETHTTDETPGPEHTGLYRNPIRMSDGIGVVVHTSDTVKDDNIGTSAAPRSRYEFRLKVLVPYDGHFRAGPPLTSGLSKSLEWWDPFVKLSYSGDLWELDPAEVAPRPVPPVPTPSLPGPELQALADEGVALQDLVAWLKSRDLALFVSRNVTTRDANDKQQPYNLRVPGGVQTVGTGGKVYDVEHLQIFQGDQVRGLQNPPFLAPHLTGGRRVLAQELHDSDAINPPNPTGPGGSVRVAPDGSVAALVPARRAMAWQLTDGEGDAVVRERYWVTFQPGEVRTCFSCHGVNGQDQSGSPPPTNKPQALKTLLQHLKSQGAL